MKSAWIALATMIACVAWGQSQPPIPSAAKHTAPEQLHCAQSNEKGPSDKSYAAISPVFVVISPTINADPTRGYQRNDSDTRQPSKESVEIIGSVITVFATIVIAVFTWRLAASTKNLWEETREAGKTASSAAKAAEHQATVMANQFDVMHEQKVIMRAALEATEKAAKAAENTAREMAYQAEDLRQARILQHRPRLHVRNIVLKEPKFLRGYPIHGQFYVSNIGGVRAHVVESHCEVLWNVNGLPMECPYEGKNGNNPMPDKPTIAPGSSATGIFTSEPTFQFDIIPGGNDPAQNKLYILGWIEYVDDLAIKRRTAFCREFRQRDGSARFYPVDDPRLRI